MPRKRQRRVRSLRTASSMRAPSSLRVRETCSREESPLSLVMGKSAPPPGGGATKYLARAAMNLATSRLESSVRFADYFGRHGNFRAVLDGLHAEERGEQVRPASDRAMIGEQQRVVVRHEWFDRRA